MAIVTTYYAPLGVTEASAGDNYPMGANADSRAPWNATDGRECPECCADVNPFWEFCPWCGERLEDGC